MTAENQTATKAPDQAKDGQDAQRTRALGRYAGTPYEPFVTWLSHKQKIRDAQGHDQYRQVENPYMPTAGRILEAWNEHVTAQKKITIKTKIDKEDDETLVVLAEIESEIRGYAMARATSHKQNRGVESSSPIETAETSAIGRALGLLGYGLLPSGGVATADEVRARATENKAPASASQKNALAKLYRQLHPDATTDELLVSGLNTIFQSAFHIDVKAANVSQASQIIARFVEQARAPKDNADDNAGADEDDGDGEG